MNPEILTLIHRLEKLHQATTGGIWQAIDDTPADAYVKSGAMMIAHYIEVIGETESLYVPDARFIAAAHELLPRLIALIREENP